MNKLLLMLLCFSSFAYADLYEKLEKAVIDSNLEATQTFLDSSSLSQKEYSQLLMLTDLIIDKRQKDCTNNHYRPFLSGAKLAYGAAACVCYKLTTCLLAKDFQYRFKTILDKIFQIKDINDIRSLNELKFNKIYVIAAYSCIAAGAGLAIKFIHSLLCQANELEKLYNNAIMIKYELEAKLKNLQAQS